jgi:hypothetical protein
MEPLEDRAQDRSGIGTCIRPAGADVARNEDRCRFLSTCASYVMVYSNAAPSREAMEIHR